MGYAFAGAGLSFSGGRRAGHGAAGSGVRYHAAGAQLVQPISVAILADTPAAQAQPVPRLADGTPVPPNALALPGGAILTSPSGTPYLIA